MNKFSRELTFAFNKVCFSQDFKIFFTSRHSHCPDGMTIGVVQSFEYFRKMQKRISDFVVAHSNISEKRFYELCMNTKELVLDIGSVVEGEQAVKEGLIERVGTLSDALGALYRLIKKNKK